MPEQKFCVFCGQRPETKNKEHILPKWLLRLTGDPNRVVRLGRNWTDPDLGSWEFSWNSFTFPSCAECNSEFAGLESQAHQVFLKMMRYAPLSSTDLNILLDWLDKVRVGLWLGMIYLNKNHAGIEVQYHIRQRVAAKDRALLVFDSGNTTRGLGMHGVDTPVFQRMPSIFGLVVNQYHFFNVSYDFLLAERLGLPYIEPGPIQGDREGLFGELKSGKGAYSLPAFWGSGVEGASCFIQPMVPNELRGLDPIPKEYQSDWARKLFPDHSDGRGKVLLESEQEIRFYSTEPTSEWRPEKRLDRHDLIEMLGLSALKAQHSTFESILPEFEGVRQDRVEEIDRANRTVLSLQRSILRLSERQVSNIRIRSLFRDT